MLQSSTFFSEGDILHPSPLHLQKDICELHGYVTHLQYAGLEGEGEDKVYVELKSEVAREGAHPEVMDVPDERIGVKGGGSLGEWMLVCKLQSRSTFQILEIPGGGSVAVEVEGAEREGTTNSCFNHLKKWRVRTCRR